MRPILSALSFFLLLGVARAVPSGTAVAERESPTFQNTRTLDVPGPGDTPAWRIGHGNLFQKDPSTGPLVWPPPPPPDPARVALGALDEVPEDFEAAPLLVMRITGLPAASGLSATQIVERFERNLLRERVVLADRMYRQGDYTNAMSLLGDLDKYLRNPRNRSLNLNRMAAYEFRKQRYESAVDLMRKAADIQKNDVVTRINLAAVLMTIGRHDEALGELLEVYPEALSRPPLSFSVHFNLACVYSMKQDAAKSLKNLAIAAQTDPASTLASLGDPQLDNLRADSRFMELALALEDFLSQKPRR